MPLSVEEKRPQSGAQRDVLYPSFGHSSTFDLDCMTFRNASLSVIRDSSMRRIFDFA